MDQCCTQHHHHKPQEFPHSKGDRKFLNTNSDHKNTYYVVACIACTYLGTDQIDHGIYRTEQHLIQFSSLNQPWQFSEGSHKEGTCNGIGKHIHPVQKQNFILGPVSHYVELIQHDQNCNKARGPCHYLRKHPDKILSTIL